MCQPILTISGEDGLAIVLGECGAASATGYKGRAVAENCESIAVAWGYYGMAKGVIGSYLAFADWIENGYNNWTQNEWSFNGAKMVRV